MTISSARTREIIEQVSRAIEDGRYVEIYRRHQTAMADAIKEALKHLPDRASPEYASAFQDAVLAQMDTGSLEQFGQVLKVMSVLEPLGDARLLLAQAMVDEAHGRTILEITGLSRAAQRECAAMLALAYAPEPPSNRVH